MEGLGLSVLINPQGREGQHFSRFLGLGLNLPPQPEHHHHQVMSFENSIGLMHEVPNNCPPVHEMVAQRVNIHVDGNGNTSEASSFAPSTSTSCNQNLRRMDMPPNNIRKSFPCDKCNKDFQYEDMLAEHLRCFHKVAKPYFCHLCHEAFRQKFSVDTHLRKEHNFDIPIKKSKIRKLSNGMYACDLCELTYTKLSKAYSHRLRHFHKRHVCVHCDMSFYEYKHLKKHLLIHDKPASRSGSVAKVNVGREKRVPKPRSKFSGNFICKKKNFCEVCHKGFHNNYALNLHVKINHEGIKPFACDICNQSFCVKKSLKMHKMRKHDIKPIESSSPKKISKPKSNDTNEPASERKHLCEHCSKQYSSKYQFRLHIKTHFGDTGQSFPCFLCEECFQDRELLNEHLIEQHDLRNSNLSIPKKSLNGLYMCADSDCDKGFEKAHSYYEHRQGIHNDRRFVCPYCDKGFTKTTTFRNHLNVHTGNRPHICLVCKIGFSNRTNLNLHMKTHLKTNPLYCAACNKSFGTRDMFMEHKVFHDGQYPYMCEKCYKGFEKEEDFQKHQVWGHRDIQRNFVCQFCNHAFVSKNTLKKHLKSYCQSVETAVERNICKFCNKSYKHFSSLTHHLKVCELNLEKEMPEKRTPARAPVKKTLAYIPLYVENIVVIEGYICKTCFLPFEDKSSIAKHVSEEHSDLEVNNEVILSLVDKNNPQDCSKADEYLSNETNIQIRLIKFICKICNIPYGSKPLFLKHVSKYHPNYVPNFEQGRTQSVLPSNNKARVPPSDDLDQSNSIVHSNTSTVIDGGESTIDEPQEESDVDWTSDNEENPDKKANCDGDFEISSKSKKVIEKRRQSPRIRNIRNSVEKPPKALTLGIFICKICKDVFRSKELLENHSRNDHSTSKNSRPSVIKKNYEKKKLNPTVVLSRVELPYEKCEYSCKICNHPYSSKSALQRHMDKDHSEEISEDEEENSISSQDDLSDDENESFTKSAKKKADKPNRVSYKCKLCKIKYSKRYYFQRHVAKYHPDYNEAEPKSFIVNTSSLSASFNATDASKPTSSKPTNVFRCKICKVPYERRHNLEKHIMNLHKDEHIDNPGDFIEVMLKNFNETDNSSNTWFKCKFCEVKYRVRGYLWNHMKKSHPDDCEDISEDSKSDSNKEDTRIENEENMISKNVDAQSLEDELSCEYYCKICIMPYELKKNLDRHIEKFHPDYYQVYPEAKPIEESAAPVSNEDEVMVPNSNNDFVPPDNIEGNFEKPDILQQLQNEVSKDLENSEENVLYHEPDPHNASYKPNNFQQTAPNPPNFNVGNTYFFQQFPNNPVNIEQPCYPTHFEKYPASIQTHTNVTNQNTFNNYVSDKPMNCYENTNIPKPHSDPHAFNQFHSYSMPHRNQFSNPSMFNKPNPYNQHMPLESHGDSFQRIVPEAVRNDKLVYCQNMPHQGNTTTYTEWERTVSGTDGQVVSSFVNGNRSYNPNGSFTNLIQPANTMTTNEPIHNVPKEVPLSKEVDEDYVPDTGFRINYDSDTADDPKIIEPIADKISKEPLNKNTDVETPRKFVDQYVNFSKPSLSDTSNSLQKKTVCSDAKAKGFFCKICPMYYLRKIYLKNHYSKEHPDSKEIIEEFNKELEEDENKKANVKYTCNICDKSFGRKDFLTRHHKNLHLLERNFVCDICNAAFKNKSNLQRHNETHIKRPYNCVECKECFKTKQLLEDHSKDCHEVGHSGGKVKCQYCNSFFKAQNYLTKHVKKKHFDEIFSDLNEPKSEIDAILSDTEKKDGKNDSTPKRTTKRKKAVSHVIYDDSTDNEVEEDDDEEFHPTKKNKGTSSLTRGNATSNSNTRKRSTIGLKRNS